MTYFVHLFSISCTALQEIARNTRNCRFLEAHSLYSAKLYGFPARWGLLLIFLPNKLRPCKRIRGLISCTWTWLIQTINITRNYLNTYNCCGTLFLLRKLIQITPSGQHQYLPIRSITNLTISILLHSKIKNTLGYP